jgi:large subunit ribosomal protein L2
MLVNLKSVPYNIPICYLKNLKNTKYSYALSAGSGSLKVKGKKKTKLITILLPSKQIYYLLSWADCLIGVLAGGLLSNSSLGKFSSNLKRKYVTKVRGVAMNPVDHPNGGRTKSKSPELSP